MEARIAVDSRTRASACSGGFVSCQHACCSAATTLLVQGPQATLAVLFGLPLYHTSTTNPTAAVACRCDTRFFCIHTIQAGTSRGEAGWLYSLQDCTGCCCMHAHNPFDFVSQFTQGSYYVCMLLWATFARGGISIDAAWGLTTGSVLCLHSLSTTFCMSWASALLLWAVRLCECVVCGVGWA